MIGRGVRFVVWALVALLFVQAAPGSAQSTPPPPTLPGEEIVVTANGCAAIMRYPPGIYMNREDFFGFTRKSNWTGRCLNGLIHGRGRLVHPDHAVTATLPELDYFYGRLFGKVISPSYNNTGTNTTYIALDGRTALISNGGGDPFAPRWGDISKNEFYTLLIAPGSVIASTTQSSCFIEQARFRGCTTENNFNVYGIQIGQPAVTIWCPDPRTPVGCEALWRQHSAPIIATIQALAAEVERDGPGYRQQILALNLERDTQIAALETARRESAERRQAAAAAAEAKARQEFEASLTSKNAGELFAMADELRSSGQTDKAREVLRAMVSRFPDHPLSVTAAQQMSAMSSAPSSSASSSAPLTYSVAPSARANPPSSASSPAAGGSCANPQAEEDRLAREQRVSGEKFPGEVVRPMESLLWGLSGIIKLYESCPSHPNAAAKLQVYRKLYSDTMTTCSQMSSTGTCTPRLH